MCVIVTFFFLPYTCAFGGRAAQLRPSARPTINGRELSTTAAFADKDAHGNQAAGRLEDGAESEDDAMDDNDDDTQDTTAPAEMSGAASSAAVFLSPAAPNGCGSHAIARHWARGMGFPLFPIPPSHFPNHRLFHSRRECYWAVPVVGGAGTHFETSEV